MKRASTINRTVEFGLRMMGIWPDSSYVTHQRLFWVTSMTLIQMFQYRCLLRNFKSNDLSKLMDSVSTTVVYSLLLLKMIVLWINSRTFHEILMSINRDWSQSEDSLQLNTMKRVAYISHRLSNVTVGLYAVTVFVYGTGVLAADNNKGSVVEVGPLSREFFLKMDLPFDSNVSPVYEVVMIVQFVHQLTSASLAGVMNALLLTLILHVGGQIDIMRQRLLGISSKNSGCTSSLITIKALIIQHQKILVFSNNIESLYTYIAFVQFISNILICCSLGFLIVISTGDPNGFPMLIKAVLFYISILTESFMFCSASEYISTKSKMIGDTAYAALWYDLNPRESRILLLLIRRSQIGLTLTIGKFMDLSMERFTSTVKIIASYISVLLTIY